MTRLSDLSSGKEVGRHTQTPWKADHGNILRAQPDEDGDPFVIFEGRSAKRKGGTQGMSPVGQCSIPSRTECEANAAHIVRAVNAFEAMRDALKSLVDALDSDGSLPTGEYYSARVQSRAALKLAEEG